MGQLLVLLGITIAWTAVGYRIGKSKGREGTGLALGLLLGLIGVVIIALLPAKKAAENAAAEVPQPNQEWGPYTRPYPQEMTRQEEAQPQA